VANLQNLFLETNGASLEISQVTEVKANTSFNSLNIIAVAPQTIWFSISKAGTLIELA
jgi:hypothetical protein